MSSGKVGSFVAAYMLWAVPSSNKDARFSHTKINKLFISNGKLSALLARADNYSLYDKIITPLNPKVGKFFIL